MSAYLQYNARCEFFSNGFFPPNPECRDDQCRARQEELKAKGVPGWLAARKERVAKARHLKASKHTQPEDQVDPEAWGIELVGESAPPKKEEFVDKAHAESATLEDLMSQLQKVSFAPGPVKEQ